LRGDEKNISGHKKRERYWRAIGEEKVAHLPQYNSFMGMRDGMGTVGDTLIFLVSVCHGSTSRVKSFFGFQLHE